MPPRIASDEPDLSPGLYEEIVSTWLDRGLSQLPPALKALRLKVPPAETPDLLSRYMVGALKSALAQVSPPEAEQRRVELCNKILSLLASELSDDLFNNWKVSPGPVLLHAVQPSHLRPFERPESSLSINALITGTRSEPNLGSQLKKEIDSADRIDILCSFIKWSGLRLVYPQLLDFCERSGTQLRVLTTTYTGATDAKAVERLRELPGAQVKVSYDSERTRMHAKAYLFGRNTGFDTAYIGSSNMSSAAFTDGLEWNVKVARHDSGHLWEKLQATFETYWNDPTFKTFHENSLPELNRALNQAVFTPHDFSTFFDLNPYDFQQEILDRLEAERSVQGRRRQLVVAATGTGKTMIAAFDYKRFSAAFTAREKRRPNLLFVAHRQEILQQSLATFRAVLRDNQFGELLYSGQEADNGRHIFASIQSYNSRRLVELAPGHFDYVVVDEFHHSGADSYRPLLNHVQPEILLGLTATPERSDSWDVTSDFGGHTSAEIRLPEAINRGLLCPFQYFGISDVVDYSVLDWKRGGYDLTQLENLLTGNHVRARLVVDELRRQLLDPTSCRALGFCVSVAHAKFMAGYFASAGLKAEALHAESPQELRRTVRERLQTGDVNYIFTVDLYNEGVDIPEVDTVLFLRPTESLTVFLQQLGRGLRKHNGKECLTVLDFIGQSHKKFRFDLRLRALQTAHPTSLNQQVENDFPYLPSGCSIVLQREAKERILANLSAAIVGNRQWLLENLRDLSSVLQRVPSLAEFLDFAHIGTEEIYRRNVTYTRLCADAGLIASLNDQDEESFAAGLRKLQHFDDVVWLQQTLKFLRGADNWLAGDDLADRRHLMLWLSLWKPKHFAQNAGENEQRLENNPTLKAELQQLLTYRLEQIREVPPLLSLPYPCPLQLHASYRRDELLAALGHWTYEKQPDLREGVLWLKALQTDIFLITLDKTPGHYSPTTMYEDYAISDRLFHWQSQSNTSSASPTGQRYIHGGDSGHTFLLFAREQKETNDLSNPYAFLGPASYASHTGDRPMSIVWRLHHPVPAHLLRKAARLAA